MRMHARIIREETLIPVWGVRGIVRWKGSAEDIGCSFPRSGERDSEDGYAIEFSPLDDREPTMHGMLEV